MSNALRRRDRRRRNRTPWNTTTERHASQPILSRTLERPARATAWWTTGARIESEIVQDTRRRQVLYAPGAGWLSQEWGGAYGAVTTAAQGDFCSPALLGLE